MTKKSNAWTIDKTAGTMIRKYDGLTETLSCNLKDLFPEWDTFNDAQKGSIVTGAKPKVDDCIAVNKTKKLTELEKITEQKAMWERLLTGEWKAPSESKTKVPTVKISDLETSIIPMYKTGTMSPESISGFLKIPLTLVNEVIATIPEDEKPKPETKLRKK